MDVNFAVPQLDFAARYLCALGEVLLLAGYLEEDIPSVVPVVVAHTLIDQTEAIFHACA